MKKCVFCAIIQGKSRQEHILDRSNSFIALRPKKPVVEGHTLVIPKQHLVTLLDIPDTLGKEFLQFTKHIASELLDTKKGDGFNVIMNNLAPAGQKVFHAHFHIIPRKEKDGLWKIHLTHAT